jgi:ribonuclease BN (tRNA processing enzyme)
MTPAEAGSVAREAGANGLLLTHLGADLTPEAAVAGARGVFTGGVQVATAGHTYTIGQT